MAFRSDCSNAPTGKPVYETLSSCANKEMRTRTQTFTVQCRKNQYIVSSADNTNTVPFIFDAKLCHEDGSSEFCSKESNEHCYSFAPFAFCCAYNTEGTTEYPIFSKFRISGIDHNNNVIKQTFPDPPPINCNLGGKRKETEWYYSLNDGKEPACYARRRTCDRPGVPQVRVKQTFHTAKECMDKTLPFNILKYTLNCGRNLGVVFVNNEPLIAKGDACRNYFDSDICNRDELCFGNKIFRYCCSPKAAAGRIVYSFAGKEYTRIQNMRSRTGMNSSVSITAN
ncbi:hypothetical protein AB6A40_006012 [Gnathostoma spinigerum]|uniref:Uncharacterized protein n=1 Tax=Gnathostoma spinigerum TaxID=75299 RepID=A0ABD6EQL8_9BILA